MEATFFFEVNIIPQHLLETIVFHQTHPSSSSSEDLLFANYLYVLASISPGLCSHLGNVVILQQLFVFCEDVLRNLITKQKDGCKIFIFETLLEAFS